MIGVISAFVLGLVLCWLATPWFIRFLRSHHFGQFIRQDGPTQHLTKRGTPTMGGLVFMVTTAVAWLVGTFLGQHGPDWSSTLLLFLFLSLGIIGLIDDGIKIGRQRSLGLHAGAKIALQLLVGCGFAALALTHPDRNGVRPGSTAISVFRPTSLDLTFAGVAVGVVLFILWVNFLVAAWSNAVNLTDGLDGLATGVSIMVVGAYTLITFIQNSQSCWSLESNVSNCYPTRDPLGLMIFCAALMGSLVGFLWWNTSPAQIFMGDTGSLAIGGAVAGLSILTNTEILAVVIGGLFVAVTLSDVIQVGVFKLTGKLYGKGHERRVFLMAPLHHHFELKGWREVTIVVRFWIVAGLFAVLGVALFYAEWVSKL